ncbi:ABC transporter ATP-binding protein [Desulfurivibrio alkaliphilus]|uniref:ABC transporter related protein n=1 Tax=Desulfurivibrio alkaliphilus (strain DSM 19089 / UNIQEM U267 / AHT2) TaxID=589865 RepID=D6Z2R5_DESAT|nr:ABC transporter ATP-binding protein [Desulfurivibrio alkaliphilus]ADH85840.1 ABC transporter related protein [Desulfurivibrio alkaliphilus AHT 2]
MSRGQGEQTPRAVAAAAAPFAIELAGLRKTYPGQRRPAVDQLTLSIPRGGIFGLLGPNGAGKSTTLALLCGLARPDGGAISFSGWEGGPASPSAKQRLGFVPQDLALYDRLSGRENLLFFGRLYGLRGQRLQQRVAHGLRLAGLETRAGQRVATYSGGMKRRLNLAVGLLHEPQILCLDEPTVGIDAQSRQSIHEQLAALAGQGVTIVYATHYLEEAEQLCRQVAIIDEGRVVVCGSPAELLQSGGFAGLGELFFSLTGKELRD